MSCQNDAKHDRCMCGKWCKTNVGFDLRVTIADENNINLQLYLLHTWCSRGKYFMQDLLFHELHPSNFWNNSPGVIWKVW